MAKSKDLSPGFGAPVGRFRAPMGKDYLFVVAIDEYKHCPRLYNCVNDATRLIEILTRKYQFQEAQIISLINEAANEYNILSRFRELVSKITPQDNLVIFYSGHGEYDKDIDEGYWIPVDAEEGHFGEYISNSRIIKFINAIKSHHTFCIVDSCFSGSLFATKRLGSASERLYSLPSRWLLTAGRNEVVSDGKAGDHSPFADNLLYLLDHNEAPLLPVTDLISHVVNAVIYNARQTPRGEPLQDVGHKGGQFYFRVPGHPVEPAVAAPISTLEPPPLQGDTVKGKNISVYFTILILSILGGLGLLKFWPDKNIAAEGNIGPVLTDSTVSASQLDNTLSTQHDSLATQNAKFRLQFAKASQLFDEGDFQDARTTFQNALVINPGSEAAEKMIRKCDDELAWKKARSENSSQAYSRYKNRFSDGRYIADASAMLKKIRKAPSPNWTYELKKDQFNVTIQRGTPPFRIQVYTRDDKKILVDKQVDSKGRFQFKLGPKEQSGQIFLVLKLTDNYQKSRQGAMIW